MGTWQNLRMITVKKFIKTENPKNRKNALFKYCESGRTVGSDRVGMVFVEKYSSAGKIVL